MPLAISMVMLKTDEPLNVSDIQRELATSYPSVPKATNLQQDDGIVSLSVGKSSIIFGKMPAPIPWTDLEGPCATSLLWRNAADEVQQHKIHWIVTVNGDLNPLELSTLLMQATAALMAVCSSSIGVYWCNATLIVPKALFIEFAKKILPHGPPLDVWVDFRIGKNSDNTSRGFTTGMQALGHMEFESQNASEPPGELRARFLALAQYVLEQGPVLKDGDTVGEDAQEKIRVIYSPSSHGQKEQVMRLVYEKSSPARPWWKLW